MHVNRLVHNNVDLDIVRLLFRHRGHAIAVFCVMTLVSCGTVASAHIGDKNKLVVARKYEVLLVPPLATGWAGWCMFVASNPGCLTSQVHRSPIVAGTWSPISGHAKIIEALLTTREVASVEFDHDWTVSTHAESALPQNLRTAVVEISANPGPPVHPQTLPSLTPLDAKGLPIPRGREPGEPLLVSVLPSRQWQLPARIPHGICQTGNTGMRGLTAQWGSGDPSSILHGGYWRIVSVVCKH
jgi:hypothetical protein